jgi:hypothetical protein
VKSGNLKRIPSTESQSDWLPQAREDLESRIEWVLRPGRWLVLLDDGTGGKLSLYPGVEQVEA